MKCCSAYRMSGLGNITLVLLAYSSIALAGDGSGIYWVGTTGTASWSNCESATPLSGTAACSLAAANANANAGHTVNLRAGDYSGTQLRPSKSGTSQNRIIFQAYQSETVTITDVASNNGGLYLSGVDYIKIDGIHFDRNWRMAHIEGGSNYNEITNCTFSNTIYGNKGGFNLYTLNATQATKNTHNWIHNNVMHNSGYISPGCGDIGWVVTMGTDAAYADDLSGHNTFEDNTIYYGAHHAFKSKTRHNVIRNNFIHNEGGFPASGCPLSPGPSGEYGNRVLTVLDDQNTGTPDTYVLIEGNRLGEAGFPSDGNGAFNLVIGGGRVIARYNVAYNSPDTNLYFRSSGNTADDNRVYNNTFYHSGYNSSSRTSPGWTRRAVWVQNNADNNKLVNNIIHDNSNGIYIRDSGAGTVKTNNWTTPLNGDPLFVDMDLSDPTNTTKPDLSLQVGSGAIDTGTNLTQARGAGSNSTSLAVDDAMFFQDGTWGSSLSNIQADWIAIGSISNIVQISSVDYNLDTITLASPMTWGDTDRIWLYKDSDGTQVLYGLAPDRGAHEFLGVTTSSLPEAPQNLRVLP